MDLSLLLRLVVQLDPLDLLLQLHQGFLVILADRWDP